MKASAFTPVKHAMNFQQKFRRSFRVDIMLSDNTRLQLRKRPDLSIQTLQNDKADKAHTNNTAVCAWWIIRIQFQDVFGEVEVLFWSHKPLILSVGKGPMKLNKLGDFDCTLDQLPTRQFLTETPQVVTGVNTLVGTNQDIWPCGYHPPSGCLFAVSQLVEMIEVSDWKYKSLPFVWRNHPKPHLMPQAAFKHLQRRTSNCSYLGRKRAKRGPPP